HPRRGVSRTAQTNSRRTPRALRRLAGGVGGGSAVRVRRDPRPSPGAGLSTSNGVGPRQGTGTSAGGSSGQVAHRGGPKSDRPGRRGRPGEPFRTGGGTPRPRRPRTG